MSDTSDHGAARARLSDSIAGIRARFVEGFAERAHELSALAREAGQPDGASARQTLRLKLHNLVGSAPTIGLPALGLRITQIEAALASAPPGSLDARLANRLAGEIEALAQDRNVLRQSNQ
ncbi:Hpt domain-containing protein [Hansschlegelia plantiphila]|nr:Hpt domain-containing protein [Hansschlegelia plantiphila]